MYSARLFVTFFPRNQWLCHKDCEILHLAAAHRVLIDSLPRWNKLDQRVLSQRTQTERKNTQNMRLFFSVSACQQALRGALAAGPRERAKSLLARYISTKTKVRRFWTTNTTRKWGLFPFPTKTSFICMTIQVHIVLQKLFIIMF